MPSAGQVMDTSFRAAVRRLDAASLLLKVQDELDWNMELTSLLAREPEQAMLLQKVKGYEMPIIGNFLASERNILTVFQTNMPGFRDFINGGMLNPILPRKVSSGAVQEMLREDPELDTILPFLKYAQQDGGRYMSGGIIVAKDPDTGVYNASYHRLMHLKRNRLLIRLDLGRHLRRLWEAAKSKNQPLPIAVVVGPDLGLIYAAAIMGAQLPFEMDEYSVASGIMRRPLDIVDGRTVPLLIPAEAELVMEGSISPHEEAEEGPFMEFVWLYSDVAPAPVVTINCVYHRRNPLCT
jgi:2,5-furandicarboxylate decarboxylase 1